MDEIFRLAEQIEIAVYRDTFQAVPKDNPAFSSFELKERGEVVWGIAPGIADPNWSGFFNQVMGLGVAGPAREELVDDIVKQYHQQAIPFLVCLNPKAQPAAVPEWLVARKVTRSSAQLAQCYRAVDQEILAVPALEIRQIDASDADTFVRVAAISLPEELHPWIAALVGRPGWHHYLAFEDGVPIAGAAMFLEHEAGYFTWTGTQPAYERRGAQTALIARRLHDAARRGCRWVFAETFEPFDTPDVSCRNLLRAEFSVAYRKEIYEG